MELQKFLFDEAGCTHTAGTLLLGWVVGEITTERLMEGLTDEYGVDADRFYSVL